MTLLIPRPRAVIFDFDLTLADSTAGFMDSHAFAAKELGLTAPGLEAVRRSIGTPLHIVVPSFYPGLSDEQVAAYISVYQARADAVMTPLTVMLPGAADAVRGLRAGGTRLAIVSQKLRYRVEDVLRREGLLDCFDVVLGGEDVPAFKPDPAGLLLALDRLAVAAADAVYAGDTTIDAEAAANAGLRFIAVLTGPTTREQHTERHPAAILDSVAGLPALLN